METKNGKARGRPRTFDLDEGVAIAQTLFQERGYDAVSVADLTAAIGINPPSFYAAYGSKAELFARVLARYTAGAPPLSVALCPGRPEAEALGQMLEDAAARYGADSCKSGCLVIESARSDDAAARCAASAFAQGTADAIRAFVARTHPALAGPVTDYMIAVMVGMSALARAGTEPDRLTAVARTASLAVQAMLPGEPRTAAASRCAPVTRAAGRRR
ncbi:MAG: TetR/AcrR family transcriptional regulator [Myxococcales bacterium]|nr:MAG: TetR/AcrR family transcriptional regulator [Myxococcales bacterium]